MIKFFGSPVDCYKYVLRCPVDHFCVYAYAPNPEIFFPYPCTISQFRETLDGDWTLFAVVSEKDVSPFYNSPFWTELGEFKRGLCLL